MEKKIYLGLLLDFYGQMLTTHQQSLMDMYCNRDYSLSEIANLLDISRQGVHDGIARAQRALELMEAQLHLATRYNAFRKGLSELKDDLSAQGLDEYAHRIGALMDAWEGQ